MFNDEKKSCRRKPCSFGGLHNHVVAECWKRMAARKRIRRERPSPHQGRKKFK